MTYSFESYKSRQIIRFCDAFGTKSGTNRLLCLLFLLPLQTEMEMKSVRHILLLLMLLATAALASAAIGVDEVKKVKFPGGRSYMYRVTLADKRNTPYSLSRPQEFLSDKALARRKRQHLALDSTDLPINPTYIDSVRQLGGEVVSSSRWNNTLLIRVQRHDIMRRIGRLRCVSSTRLVWTAPDSIDASPKRARFHTEFNSWDAVEQSEYGVAEEQISMLNGERLHSAGYRGEGMTIAVLDGGFMNVDMIPCMQSVKILGTADFVTPRSRSIFKELDHGTKVLSVLATDVKNVFVGTAPAASYWLLRCEDNYTESLAEEDYWAAAAEFADSVGCDIISSSLGFNTFDNKQDSYSYRDLDGKTALISRTASMLAAKGIVLVNSAGNDGMGVWKKINVPADAKDILSVGAVSPNKRNAAFSSIGPSADGRVKPDIMALGSPTAVITGRGTIVRDMGTSFATPVVSGLVACLWQALKDKTATEIMNLVRRSGDNTDYPDNITGYGIPDFWKVYNAGRQNR